MTPQTERTSQAANDLNGGLFAQSDRWQRLLKAPARQHSIVVQILTTESRSKINEDVGPTRARSLQRKGTLSKVALRRRRVKVPAPRPPALARRRLEIGPAASPAS